MLKLADIKVEVCFQIHCLFGCHKLVQALIELDLGLLQVAFRFELLKGVTVGLPLSERPVFSLVKLTFDHHASIKLAK